MRYNKEKKHALPAVSTIVDYLKHSREALRVPENIIFCPTTILTNTVANNYKTKKHVLNWGGDVYVFDGKNVAFATNFGMGNPAMAMAMEVLIGLGAKRFILTGIAGSLQQSLNIGDIVLCSGAVRDEGVSSSYIPYSDIAYPDKNLTDKLESSFTKDNIKKGLTWTTDVLFRETKEEILHYQEKGVMTVEMEAAAAFSIAEHYKVPAAAVFAISDQLANYKWEPAFGDKKTDAAMRRNLEVCLEIFK